MSRNKAKQQARDEHNRKRQRIEQALQASIARRDAERIRTFTACLSMEVYQYTQQLQSL